MTYLIITASILLQLLATVLALRLIPQTGSRWSWIILSCGLVGMVVRRAYVLSLMYLDQATPNMTFEIVGLFVSIAFFMAMIKIRPVFTQLKEVNEKLAQSESRFRTVADFTYDWEYWRGPDGKFLYVSPSCVRVTGYSPAEFIANPTLLEHIVHPEEKEIVAAHMALELRGKSATSLDFRIIAKDGSTHWIGHRCTSVRDTLGQHLGIRASNRNIDNRKHAEALLKQSQRQYHDLVEQAGSIILELDAAGKVLFLNKFGQNFFQRQSEEAIKNITFDSIFSTKNKEWDREKILSKPASSSEAPPFTEGEIVRKDGSRAWLSWANSLMYDESGAIKGVLCVGIDITTKKAAETLKEDVERIVRHDLKSPLLGIIGLPHLLQEDANLTSRQKEMLEAVEEAGKQMMALINQSLNLYKLESGTYVYQPVPVDLLKIVRNVIRDLIACHSKALPIHITIDGKPAAKDAQLIIPGDATLLYGMVANLIKNALESAGTQPVRVAFQTGIFCIMDVHNSIEVPFEIQNVFFDKYITQGKSGGTGLGTYSARLAVRAHKGKISLQSSKKEGTTVRVELPARN